MTLLFNSNAIPTPSALATEWVTVAADNLVYRQLVLSWGLLTQAEAAAILGPASAPAGVAVSWPNPATNTNISLTFKIYAASVPILRETGAALTYHNTTLTLREVLP